MVKMKKIVKTVMVGAVAAGVLLPTQAFAKIDELQGEAYTTIGVSVTNNQETYNNTINLLGAQDTEIDNIMVVDGVVINTYLGDGSDINTTVFSSAHISFNEDATGVTVEVKTPEAILDVTQATYINAAITSGIQDAHITIASAEPVTGEGALAGIYAIMEREGVLEQGVSQLAQEELAIITETVEDGTNQEQINAVMSDVKAEIAQAVQNGDIINGDKIVTIVNNTLNTYNITLPDWAKDRIVQFGTEFAQTDVAANEDTLNQLKALSDDLFEQGGELFDGVKSKLQDPDFQQEAKGFLGQMLQGLQSFFSGLGNLLGGLFS